MFFFLVLPELASRPVVWAKSTVNLPRGWGWGFLKESRTKPQLEGLLRERGEDSFSLEADSLLQLPDPLGRFTDIVIDEAMPRHTHRYHLSRWFRKNENSCT